MPRRARAGLHQSSNAPIEVSYTQRPGVMQLVIMVHLAWSACAGSSLGVRVPCLKHLNIITAHGRTSTIRSSPTEASQFQCRAKPKATAAPEKRYSAKRYRTK